MRLGLPFLMRRAMCSARAQTAVAFNADGTGGTAAGLVTEDPGTGGLRP